MMRRTILVALAPLASLLGAAAVHAAPPQRPDPQGEARREMRAGTILSVREIERRILPTRQGTQYLGPEYDPAAMAYRLKFIRDGHVSFVDVDARTGEIIAESH